MWKVEQKLEHDSLSGMARIVSQHQAKKKDRRNSPILLIFRDLEKQLKLPS